MLSIPTCKSAGTGTALKVLAPGVTFVLWLRLTQEGPQISWRDLTSFQNCTEGGRAYSCEIFESRRPSTIAMTVLVGDAVACHGTRPVVLIALRESGRCLARNLNTSLLSQMQLR